MRTQSWIKNRVTDVFKKGTILRRERYLKRNAINRNRILSRNTGKIVNTFQNIVAILKLIKTCLNKRLLPKYTLAYIYIYIYIYIVIHRQICFVLSELICVARQYLPVAGIETRLTQTPSQSF